MYQAGYSYEPVNSARSALSSLCTIQDGHSVGSHPLVVRFVTGLFNLRPSKLKYVQFWVTSKVLCYLRQLPPVKDISLKMLTWKLVVLVALTQASRSHSMSLLTLEGMVKNGNTYTLFYANLLKQCRKGRWNPIVTINIDSRICVYSTLQEYIRQTEDIHGSQKRLFISYIKPFKVVSSPTISRWIRSVMQLSGIDTNLFKSHSVRGAAASKAKLSGVSIQDILKVASWATERTFATFYNKRLQSIDQSNFDEAVLG